MRYLNEQRALFLSVNPLGFQNKCKFYADYRKPPFFNWLSSQSWWLYILAILNAALLAVLLYIAKINIGWIIFICLTSIAGQLLCGIVYLKSRENKSTSHAVFGDKR